MIGRAKDYVCLTSVSLLLNVAVRVIQHLRRVPKSLKSPAVVPVYTVNNLLILQQPKTFQR